MPSFIMERTWYRKYKLIDFDHQMIVPFGDGEYFTSYNLKIKVVYFWGLFERIKIIPVEVSMFQSVNQFERHWKNIIEQNEYL